MGEEKAYFGGEKKVERSKFWEAVWLEMRMFGSADLDCDGNRVTVVLAIDRGNLAKTVIGFKVGDMIVEGESPFSRESVASKWTAKTRREMRKIPAKRLKQNGYDPDEKRVSQVSHWTSFNNMVDAFDDRFKVVRHFPSPVAALIIGRM